MCITNVTITLFSLLRIVFRYLKVWSKHWVAHDFELISSWKDVQEIELNVQKDHIHLVCSIPPKVSKPEYMGVLKGKMAAKSIRCVAKWLGEALVYSKTKRSLGYWIWETLQRRLGTLINQCFSLSCSLFRVNRSFFQSLVVFMAIQNRFNNLKVTGCLDKVFGIVAVVQQFFQLLLVHLQVF